jgi:Fur family transcriptional regulator, ferric uptake regulator
MSHTLHRQEKEQFCKLFKQDQIADFEDRFAVMEIFMQTDGHISSADLTTRLVDKGTRLEPEFVRDTLKLMCQYGFARKHQFDNGDVLYEHLHLGQHHDHMICTTCRKIVEFEDPQLETLQIQAAERHGFHLLQHKMEMYGICAQCMASRRTMLPLAEAPRGERLVVARIDGGPMARARLMAMGLRIGDELDVIINSGQGQMVIGADYKRIVVGRGLARKLMVQIKSNTA